MRRRFPAKIFRVKVQVVNAVFVLTHVVAVVTFDVEVVTLDVLVFDLMRVEWLS